MKRNKWFMMLIMLLLLGACQDKEEMTTIIYPDGSCEKVFYGTVDDKFLQGERTGATNPFPVEVDSLWEMTILDTLLPAFDSASSVNERKTAKENNEKRTLNFEQKGSVPKIQYNVKIHRKFSSVKQMNKEFCRKKEDAWSTMSNQASLQRKFRWFYTYYVFKETYNKVEYPFPMVEKGTLDEEELNFFCHGDGEVLKGMNGPEIKDYVDSLTRKYDAWIAESYWNAVFSEILLHYDEKLFYPISKEEIENYGKMMLDSLMTNHFDDVLGLLVCIDLKKQMNDHFHTNKFNFLWDGDQAPMARFQEKVSNSQYYRYGEKKLCYRLQMPGRLLSTNGVKTADNSALWQLDVHRMERGDYVLEAVSGRSNLWAFFIAGLVLVAAVGGYVFGKRKF